MGSVRVAIVGAGNCASSLVQGVEYYKDADSASRVPGLMHVQFGEYHVGDLEFVAAFQKIQLHRESHSCNVSAQLLHQLNSSFHRATGSEQIVH